MVTKSKSRRKRTTRRSREFRQAVLGKPNGIIQPRVQEVGPERFGIVAVDCAKARSKWMLADFYGRVLLPPQTVEHNRNSLRLAVFTLRQAVQQRGLKDVIVCVEMTGTYHKPVRRAFRDGGFETRRPTCGVCPHPFASSYYRPPEHGDLKTDDNDLAAIFRASVNGFGLIEKPVPPLYQELQILARHRRDLVRKRSKLQCQIRHHVERVLPGFGALFDGDDLWTQVTPLPLLKLIARLGGTPPTVTQAGGDALAARLREDGVRFHRPTIDRVVVWAANAASCDEMVASHTRVWQALLEDWETKQRQIMALERDVAGLLVQTPYILLLSHPGINVISAAELGGEMGPIENYASANAISGRAGLFPSRYQSDGVDRGGNLSRFRNARLRAAWLLVADNMCKCNAYWRARSALWKSQGENPRDIHCRVANRITRAVFAMVSGRQIDHHPSRLNRGYVMDKLLEFHREHGTPPHVIVGDLKRAAEQIPAAARADEAQPLREICQRSQRSRRSGPQELGTLLVAVLARLGVTDVESQ